MAKRGRPKKRVEEELPPDEEAAEPERQETNELPRSVIPDLSDGTIPDTESEQEPEILPLGSMPQGELYELLESPKTSKEIREAVEWEITGRRASIRLNVIPLKSKAELRDLLDGKSANKWDRKLIERELRSRKAEEPEEKPE